MRECPGENSVVSYPHSIAIATVLRDIDKPMAVAEWQVRLTRELPAELESRLPSIDEIERELGDGE